MVVQRFDDHALLMATIYFIIAKMLSANGRVWNIVSQHMSQHWVLKQRAGAPPCFRQGTCLLLPASPLDSNWLAPEVPFNVRKTNFDILRQILTFLPNLGGPKCISVLLLLHLSWLVPDLFCFWCSNWLLNRDILRWKVNRRRQTNNIYCASLFGHNQISSCQKCRKGL